MSKYTVLLPVDGSEFSRQIFSHVSKFLSPDECRLILMQVGPVPVGYVGHPARMAAAESRIEMYESVRDVEESAHPIYASQVWDSVAAELRGKLQPNIRMLETAGYEVEFEARYGEPAEEIVNYIETHDVDMVAMTTHWRSGLSRLMFGSVAKYIVEHVTVPIMVVHPQD